MEVQIDREHLTRMLSELVATNSVNPTLVPGAQHLEPQRQMTPCGQPTLLRASHMNS